MAGKATTPIQLGGFEATTETIFQSADGTSYGIPQPVPANLSLEALEIMAKSGEPVAVVWLMKELFGDGYAVLKEEASNAQLAAVMDIVSNKVFGELEGKG